MRHRSPRAPLAAAIVAAAATVALVGSSSPAGAHTEADLVAVAAGDHATLTLKPTHGCDGSPTVEVAIQAPVTGATAVDVDGWTATATDDLATGTTVLEWTGGSLPADATGEFGVELTVPDNVGELLVFPAVQVCENGEEMAWIDGDPEGSYPAPRILVLPAGTPAAATIDDVPADAPGRDLLTAIIDVDNPGGGGSDAGPDEATTAPDSADEGTGDEPTTDETPPADDVVGEETDDPTTAETADDASEDDGGSNAGLIVGALVVVAIGAAAAVVLTRRRSTD